MWPTGSGKRRAFPKVDRAGWFEESTAADKLHKGQVPLLDRLRRYLEGSTTY
ncbi:MAG: hypothetical protein K9K39_02125 [Desulfohalobiaceae bacterium]|nr:hypothetical protein [Desulfohalobiaceae bacterium]